ncbi:LutC/YkgG family protein [Cellulomonas endometrii]|uniref:LutC/YkgG family protein n=1 Tax=Cellulomonas endometrii TaxID=3036301 RepID=UPI0024AD59BF|nr:LUD domain-containing protein [Cellulomonas endometrii]
MSDARDEVLARVRAALGRTDEPGAPGAPGAPAAPAPVERAYRRAGSLAAAGDAALVDRLVDRLEDYRATVVRCTAADLPAAVAAQLAGAGSVAVPPGLDRAWVAALDGRVGVRVDDPAAPLSHADLDGVGAVLTACRVAVAETGTIVLDAAPDQGRRVLTLLPDRHVCVVRAGQVVAGVPDAVAVLGAHPERPQTWISGPSATSDIELVRVEGVHGPRDLRVLLVDP